MDTPPPSLSVVMVTAPPHAADVLARTLVDEGLCACVNVLPAVRSTYRWQGAVHQDDEALLLIKVADSGLVSLRARLLALHPYELPEFLVLGVDAARSHDAYVRWVLGGGV